MNPATLNEKYSNIKKIIEFVIQYGSISRPYLAQLTGLSSATITNLVVDLLKKNVLIEKGKYESALGRKAKLLEFNNKLGYIIGVKLEPTLPTEIYLSDIIGELIDRKQLNMDLVISSKNNEEKLVDNIILNIRNFYNTIDPAYKKKIFAIGISIPGFVTFNECIYSPLFHWRNIPLKASIQNAFNIPTFIENVTRIKSIYEFRFIKKEEDKNVVYLALSPGIGMVNSFESKIIKGKHAVAGEAGHMSLDAYGPQCYCGNKGCFEIYCGEDNILKKARALIRNNESPILSSVIENDLNNLNIKSLFKAQVEGDMKVYSLLSQAGFYLGCGLSNIINCFDPDRLIISGDLISEGDMVYNCALEETRKRIINIYTREIIVEKSKLKSNEIVRSIAAFLLTKIINDIIT